MEIDIGKYPTLRDDQRIEARQRARGNLLLKLGGEPQLEHYISRQWSRFGKTWDVVTLAACILVLLAAFGISAQHIFKTGERITLAGGSGENTALTVGAFLVVLAEASILALSLAPTVWCASKGVTRAMYIGVACASLIATVGNLDAVLLYSSTPFDWVSEWVKSLATAPGQWILATLPPLMTVLVGLGLKSYALKQSEGRETARVQYVADMKNWNSIVDRLEDHAEWRNTYAWAIWDIWRKNKRREVLIEISDQERQAIVAREMAADRFFNEEIAEISEIQRKTTENNNHAVRRVVEYLDEDPSRFQLSGAEISEILQVSEPSVSRGKKLVAKNGYHSIEGEARP